MSSNCDLTTHTAQHNRELGDREDVPIDFRVVELLLSAAQDPEVGLGPRAHALLFLFFGCVLMIHNQLVIALTTSLEKAPRHPVGDAHEWMNEIPTVPTNNLAKPQQRERAWNNQWGKKTLLSLNPTDLVK